MTVIRHAFGALVGAGIGIGLALACLWVAGVERFALTTARVLAGYAFSATTGAVVFGLCWRPPEGVPRAWRRLVMGGVAGSFLHGVAQCAALPWVNLHAVGAGGGPAQELALITLPALGLLFGAILERFSRRIGEKA